MLSFHLLHALTGQPLSSALWFISITDPSTGSQALDKEVLEKVKAEIEEELKHLDEEILEGLCILVDFLPVLLMLFWLKAEIFYSQLSCYNIGNCISVINIQFKMLVYSWAVQLYFLVIVTRWDKMVSLIKSPKHYFY